MSPAYVLGQAGGRWYRSARSCPDSSAHASRWVSSRRRRCPAWRRQPVSAAGVLSVDGARYRGAIRVLPAGGGRLEVVDVVEIEQYLQGVVPREMPAQWGDQAPAALEAQAVAARSYAVATLNPKA